MAHYLGSNMCGAPELKQGLHRLKRPWTISQKHRSVTCSTHQVTGLWKRSCYPRRGAYIYIYPQKPVRVRECACVRLCVFSASFSAQFCSGNLAKPPGQPPGCYGRLLTGWCCSEPRLVWSVPKLQCVPFFDISVWGGAGGSVLHLTSWELLHKIWFSLINASGAVFPFNSACVGLGFLTLVCVSVCVCTCARPCVCDGLLVHIKDTSSVSCFLFFLLSAVFHFKLGLIFHLWLLHF